jgi:hypothetical protein
MNKYTQHRIKIRQTSPDTNSENTHHRINIHKNILQQHMIQYANIDSN